MRSDNNTLLALPLILILILILSFLSIFVCVLVFAVLIGISRIQSWDYWVGKQNRLRWPASTTFSINSAVGIVGVAAPWRLAHARSE